jgi:hypothetical protein
MATEAIATGELRTLTGRSFRVQFRDEADLARGVCSGRIEHTRSGDAAHFGTIEELLTFVRFWLGRDDEVARQWDQRRGRT